MLSARGSVRRSNEIAAAAAGHLLVGGVTSPFTGNYASHGHFTTLPAGTTVVTLVTGTTNPTLITYRLGDGLVIASGQPLEWGYIHGQPTGVILRNALSYGGNLETFRLVQPAGRGPATGRSSTDR